MATATESHASRVTLRADGSEQVSPLELFFDLVFVLAITQCTALMAAQTTWNGLAKGLLVLGVLWWAWVGYAWLTSVVDPEDDVVRLTLFAAMAALLVAALCVPRAFGDNAKLFAVAYAFVRGAHIVLFLAACKDNPRMRQSVFGLAIGTALGAGLILAASFTDGHTQGALFALALVLDAAEPFFFGAEGWALVPRHFAERHGLIIIIALGESIVAIGVGATHGIDTGVAVAAVLGMAVTAALWWLYFDVVALVAVRRLENAHEGRERNEIARDSFSYLHFPMVAGIVLLALGFKKTLGHVEEPLKIVAATALLGGTAMYLLAHVAFRWRNIHTFNRQRTIAALACLALLPLHGEVSSLALLGILAGLLVALVSYERIALADKRNDLRRRLLH